MFVIWGWRWRVQQLEMINLVCQRCGNPAAHGLYRRVMKFTLFFIPLFPVRVIYTLQCTFCGIDQNLAKDAAMRLVDQAKAHEARSPMPQAHPELNRELDRGGRQQP
jgi:hypothetical protein